jgi:hypothetical protein
MDTMMGRIGTLIATLILGGGMVLAAQEQSKTPPKPLQVTVVSVTGQGEKMIAGKDQKWTALKQGEKLEEMTVIRTGLRSKVVLEFADRGKTTVGSGTKVGIAEFAKEGNLVRSHLGLKYGTLQVAVDSTRGPNDAKVTTPVATLSVRGTSGQIGFAGNNIALRGQTGTWKVASANRARNVVAGESTDGNLTPPIKVAKDNRDDTLAIKGLTDAEISQLIDNPPSRSQNSPGGSGSTLGDDKSTTILPDDSNIHIILGT